MSQVPQFETQPSFTPFPESLFTFDPTVATADADAMKARLHALGYSEDDIRELAGFVGDTVWDDEPVDMSEYDAAEQARLTIHDMLKNWEAFEGLGLERMVEEFESNGGGHYAV